MLRATLWVELTAPRGPGPDADELWAEMTKEVDLPFAPSPGLVLVLPCRDAGPGPPPGGPAWCIPASGAFLIDQVSYSIDDQTFRLKAGDRYASEEELDAIIAQLMRNFGFEQDSDSRWDDGE